MFSLTSTRPSYLITWRHVQWSTEWISQIHSFIKPALLQSQCFFFVIRKLILQMHMRSHPVKQDVWFLVGPFVYFHTSCVRTAKALARMRRCAGLPEPSLVAYVISTIISWAGSFIIDATCLFVQHFFTVKLLHNHWIEKSNDVTSDKAPNENCVNKAH